MNVQNLTFNSLEAEISCKFGSGPLISVTQCILEPKHDEAAIDLIIEGFMKIHEKLFHSEC